MKNRIFVYFLALIGLVFSLAGCGEQSTPEATIAPAPQESTVEVIPTSTPEPTPEPTQEPAALSVNGIGIPLAYFQDELARYKISFTAEESVPDDPSSIQAVTDYLTEQLLLAAAARQGGYTASAEEVDQRIEALKAELGSEEALTNWTSANYFDQDEFRFFIGLGAEAAWQRDQILATIPDQTEQVRARQIFTISESEINQAYNNLNAGSDFEQLAKNFNPDTGGELGWFPRGYLLIPQIEEFAFSAGVGAHSPVIQSEIGYHIVQVTDHDPAHPLTTDAKLSLQAKALASWLENAKATATISSTLQP